MAQETTTKKKKKKPAHKNLAFDNLLTKFGIEQWDLILVGDGSGSSWERECGWAVTAIERNMKRTVFYGAMNRGTVNFAEAMAYLQPLTWFMTQEQERRRREPDDVRPRCVHIITDSQYVRMRGDQRNANVKWNQGLWVVFEIIQRQGFVISWHHADREVVALNTFADRLSKKARVLVKDSDLDSFTVGGRDEYGCNPWK